MSVARRIAALAGSTVVGVAALVGMQGTAHAYGGDGTNNVWQVGISENCNNPSFCGNETGGFWGWAEFDQSKSLTGTNTGTDGDGEFAGCGHTVGGVGGPGGAGAGHISIDITSWSIESGAAGPQTFFATGTETDFSPGGVRTSFPFAHADTGIPATPGHYNTADVFGFTPAPGVAIQIQVAYKPAR